MDLKNNNKRPSFLSILQSQKPSSTWGGLFFLMNVKEACVREKEIKKDDVIKFKSLCELSGKEVILKGIIVGDHEAVRKEFPEECAEAGEGAYLVKVENRSGFYAVMDYEILETKKRDSREIIEM